MKIKLSWKVILTCLMWFIVGAFVGYEIAGCTQNRGYGIDLVCADGAEPDKNGCCVGEVYTDMGDLGFNCCPEDGGDCYPPIR